MQNLVPLRRTLLGQEKEYAEESMSKNVPEEVLVLRFFESGPIDKVEAVFNIVSEKMRERLRDHPPESQPATTGARRRQRQKADQPPAELTQQELAE